MGSRLMPTVLKLGSYVLFFWLNETGEPVHIHVARGRPSKHATKFWLTASGGCVLASNGSRLSPKTLKSMERVITANHTEICERWIERFGAGSLRFHV